MCLVSEIRAHLDAPEQEPVAWMQKNACGIVDARNKEEHPASFVYFDVPLYTHPALIPPGMVQVGWSIIYNGEHTGNFWTQEDVAVEQMNQLTATYPGPVREVVPLFAAAKGE